MAQNRPSPVAVDQLLQPGLSPGQGSVQPGRFQLRHVLFGKVHPGGQMAGQLGQIGLNGPDAPGQCAAQLGRRQGRPLPPGRPDDLHHGLGLGQAHAAVFQRAAGKLARPGGGGPGLQAGLHQPVRHGPPAVAGKLHHVLAGVAVGGAVKQGDHLVHALAVQQIMAEQGRVALGLGHLFGGVCGPEHPLGHRVRRRAGQAHHRNAALTGRGGQRTDGSVQIQHSSFPHSAAAHRRTAQKIAKSKIRYIVTQGR